jgi:predicted SnoaL-like aldol condensation-catalyzing enzyme
MTRIRLAAARRTLMAGAVALPVLALALPAAADAQLEANKKLVVDFYNMIFLQHKTAEAFKRYSIADYKQHNPYAANGAQPAIDFLAGRFKKFPEAKNVIKRVIAEGDLVALHVHSTLHAKDRGRAIVDIFRVKGGKVVEHWDVIQKIPAKSANDNTMF